MEFGQVQSGPMEPRPAWFVATPLVPVGFVLVQLVPVQSGLAWFVPGQFDPAGHRIVPPLVAGFEPTGAKQVQK